jgi:hypothetical protein
VFAHIFLGDSIVFDGLVFGASIASGVALSRTLEFSALGAARPSLLFASFVGAMGVCGVLLVNRSILTHTHVYGNPPLGAQNDGLHNYWWTQYPRLGNYFRHNATFETVDGWRRLHAALSLYETAMNEGASRRLVVGVGNSYIQSSGYMLAMHARDMRLAYREFLIMNCSEEKAATCSAAFDFVERFLAKRKDDLALVYVAFRNMEANPLVVRNVKKLLEMVEGDRVRVVIQGPSPAFEGYDPIMCIPRTRCSATRPRPADAASVAESERSLQRIIAQRPNASVWTPYGALCNSRDCVVGTDVVSYFIDSDHFSIAGQRFLLPHLLAHLQAQERTQDAGPVETGASPKPDAAPAPASAAATPPQGISPPP